MNQKISTDWDGKPRTLFSLNCFICNKEFWVPKHRISEGLCCSHECGNKKRRNREIINCSWCDKQIERTPSKKTNSRSGHYFCDRDCKEKAQCVTNMQVEEIQPNHYGTAEIPGYRLKALKFLDNRCNVCHYSQEILMLDVHHKDGNRSNGELQNLEILCVWCHALKTRNVEYHDR